MCIHSYVGFKDTVATLVCHTGKISAIFHTGLIPSLHTEGNYCGDPLNDLKIEECTQYLDVDSLQKAFNKSCLGNTSCVFNPT